MKTIKPVKKLSGVIKLPGDKSISHRAVMIGALSKGVTKAANILKCDDCDRTIRAFLQMGVDIKTKNGLTLIKGGGLHGLAKPSGPLDMGESGTSMRLLSGILAGQEFGSVLECDRSLSKRPMRRITEPLSLMGAIIDTASGGVPPLKIKGGKLKAISYDMPLASAQVKSAILLAGLYARGITVVREPARSRDHTERMLKYFGAKIRIKGLETAVTGGGEMKAKTLDIPSDISSASFFMVGASILDGSNITIKNVGINPSRAGILKIMSKMGASIRISNRRSGFEPTADIAVRSAKTGGIRIGAREIPAIIDELPVIFVLAALSSGRTVIYGIEELRVKETDRIASMKYNLRMMGARIEDKGSDMIIEGDQCLKGARLKSFGDHRTCMAMAVAALAADGPSAIDDTGCVNKSLPGFFDILGKASNYSATQF